MVCPVIQCMSTFPFRSALDRGVSRHVSPEIWGNVRFIQVRLHKVRAVAIVLEGSHWFAMCYGTSQLT